MSESEGSDAYLAAETTVKAVLTGIVGLGVLVFQDGVNAYVGQLVAELVVLLLVSFIFSGD